jgi:predicted DCC family thiol-disulfide oxidoreductase YuxK
MALSVFYDGECPLCSRYVGMLRLQRVQDVQLLDLRGDPAARQALAAQGFAVDQGMVVDQDGQRFGGARAVNVLALLTTPSNAFNRINRAVFSSPTLSALLYPLLRMGRWLVLLLLDRNLMDGADFRSDSQRTIFTICFALFSVFHFGNYATAYGRFPPGWDQVLLLGTAIFAFFKPHSSRTLFLLMLISTISAWVQAPAQSNHTITRNFLLLGYWLSFAGAMLRNLRPEAIFANFIPAVQGVLLVMYAFGIFHKINADFLNPATSCAVALWRTMPWPLPLLHGPPMEAAAIYGTFAVEGGIMVALLIPRWRHWGVAAGIAFHLLLALSAYAMYIAFTVLSIAMHSLFLGDRAADRILASPEMVFLRSRLRDPAYLLGALVLLVALGVVAFRGFYGEASLFALPLVLPFCWLVLRYGREDAAGAGPRGRMAWGIAATTFALFFINCATPYLGLKSAQSLNMFANLRLESGVSNHLILRNAPGPFGYLADVATITDDGSDPDLAYYRERGLAIVYYDLLATMDRKPGVTIAYERGGKSYAGITRAALIHDIRSTLHPWWIRKWFHFQPASLARPEPCNL